MFSNIESMRMLSNCLHAINVPVAKDKTLTLKLRYCENAYLSLATSVFDMPTLAVVCGLTKSNN